MYLHIGQNEIIPDRRIIGIFDLDKCSYSKRTRFQNPQTVSPKPPYSSSFPLSARFFSVEELSWER